jgi:hypothetical protein
MSTPKPEHYTLDTSVSFTPSKFHYIQRPLGPTRWASIKDISEHAPNSTVSWTDKELNELKAAASKIDKSTYGIKRASLLSTTYSITDSKNEERCQLSASLLRPNEKKFTFPADSPHSSHPLEMRPSGYARSSEYFTIDSVLYFWEVDTSKRCCLFKVQGDKKLRVAQYGAKHGYSHEGMLAVDGDHIDVVIAIVTCFALLIRSDSFSGRA